MPLNYNLRVNAGIIVQFYGLQETWHHLIGGETIHGARLGEQNAAPPKILRTAPFSGTYAVSVSKLTHADTPLQIRK